MTRTKALVIRRAVAAMVADGSLATPLNRADTREVARAWEPGRGHRLAAPSRPSWRDPQVGSTIEGDDRPARRRTALRLWVSALEEYLQTRRFPELMPAATMFARCATDALCEADKLRPCPSAPDALRALLGAARRALTTSQTSPARVGNAGRQPDPGPAHPRTRVHALCAAPGAPGALLTPAAA
jgi:hypothetical protein